MKFLKSEANAEGYNIKNCPCDFLVNNECILEDNKDKKLTINLLKNFAESAWPGAYYVISLSKVKDKQTKERKKKMRYVLKDKKVKYWTVEQILAYKNGASVEEVEKMAVR